MDKNTKVHIHPEKSDSLPFVDPAILKEVIAILEKRFATKVQIKSVQFISEPERRNVLLRITIKHSHDGAPTSLILKQALHQESSKEDEEALARFARDWAGLDFLTALNSPIVPKVYGGNHEHRFVLLEDLGAVHLSLVDSLMGSDKEVALEALKRFVQTLGQLHGEAHGYLEDYKKQLISFNPNAKFWLDDIEGMLSKLKNVLEKCDILLTAGMEQEISDIYDTCKDQSHFITLVHGDICPDNVFDDPDKNRMHIIDFEWGFLGNALLDGTYLRMSNPTCWCVKALPEDIIEPLEKIYRQELIKKIPTALDDELYFNSYVSACAYWMLWSVIRMDKILEADIEVHYDKPPLHPKWKADYKLQQPRTLARIEAFVTVSKKHHRLPNLRLLAETILKDLRSRWVDVKSLDVFPAFVNTVYPNIS